MKVLLVDDIPLMRSVLSKHLRTVGPKIVAELQPGGTVEVVEADSGEAALDALRKGNIGLVFLDLMMPDMDGLTFLSIRQREARLRNVPVVVCSALTEKSTFEQACDLGASAYIVKPFTAKLVEQTLREVLAAGEA